MRMDSCETKHGGSSRICTTATDFLNGLTITNEITGGLLTYIINLFTRTL